MLGLLFVDKIGEQDPKNKKQKKKKPNNKHLNKIHMDAKYYQTETLITNIDGLSQRVKKYQ